jgi:tripartite ATP-independent transporter DctM subunit
VSITFLVFFLAITLAVPIAFALGFAGAAHLLLSGQANLNVLPTIMFGAMDSFPLLAIPFFILAGDLMGRSGMLDRVIDLLRALVGPVRGGLAHVTIGAAMAFGGISGVSLADCAAIGKALIPGLVKEGYPRSVAAAITAGSCVMGAIVPPSVGMLIIAYLYGGKLSVGRLFLSGAIPGVLIGLTQMALVALVAKRRRFPVSARPWSMRGIVRTLPRAAAGLGTAVIVIGGIVSGFFTPTEAGAAAVAYALVFGSFGGLRLGWRDITTALLDSAKLSGVVFIMVAASQVVSHDPAATRPHAPAVHHLAADVPDRGHGDRDPAGVPPGGGPDHDHARPGGGADGATVRGRAPSPGARHPHVGAVRHPHASRGAGGVHGRPDRGL